MSFALRNGIATLEDIFRRNFCEKGKFSHNFKEMTIIWPISLGKLSFQNDSPDF